MASTYWFMGLPFDLVNVSDVTTQIQAAAAASSRLVLATPNLDFLSIARNDVEFRETVLRSQLSVVDGMPLVWFGRLMGVPFPGRVAGSDVFEALRASAKERLGVCFLGGEDSSAEEALAALNEAGGSVYGAGALNPGHGDLELLGRPEVLSAVNGSGAKFLVVALGAQKGQLWIDRYADALDVPVVSHMGAVVNYTAGRLTRAPVWMRRTGTEWVWRMLHEPRLARRYAGDAVYLLRELVTAALPLICWRAWRKLRKAKVAFEAVMSPESGRLMLSGVLNESTLPLLEAAVEAVGPRGELTLSLDGLEYLDAAGIGYLYTLCYRRPKGSKVVLTGGSPAVLRLLYLYRAGSLMDKVDASVTADLLLEPETSRLEAAFRDVPASEGHAGRPLSHAASVGASS